MNEKMYFDLLKKHGQEHVLKFWDELSEQQQEALVRQIESIDFSLLDKLTGLTQSDGPTGNPVSLGLAETISLSERKSKDAEMTGLGEALLKEGKVGAFLVAGGQGSRLGFDGPKGIYPITPVKKKSLFQLHAEKILAMSIKYKKVIPWYIMTSMENHEDTVAFFEKNNYFGLNKKDVMFFSQEMLPAVDKKGKLLLADKDKIFMSPNGHGGSLKALWDSGAHADLVKRKIEYLFYFQVDNVLVNICDPAFLGYHRNYKAQMSSKVVRKAFPGEKMGVICKINGKTGVVEYSNLSEEDMYAKDENGELKYWAGSIAIHFIDTQFIEMENKRGFQLPYHLAEKSIPFVGSDGRKIKPEVKNGYKFETFVFDALAHCQNTITLEVSRENEFSALKNKKGVDSEETAISDLNNLYLRWLHKAGMALSDTNTDDDIKVEISPLFALSEEELLKRKEALPAYSKKMYIE